MAEKQFVIPNYLGGIHEEVDSSLLKNNEAAKAQNCNIDKGVLKSCSGISATHITGSASKTLMTYYENGVNYLIAVWNGIVYKWTGTMWVSINGGLNLSADRYDFINDNVDGKDVLVFTNQVDNVKYYDGTTFRDLKKLGKNSTPNAVNNTIKGKYLVMHYERLWIADDNSVYASSATRDGFDIEDFTTPTTETEVNMHGFEIDLYGADGKIIGMQVVFDDVIIFKEKSIYKIFGSDPSNYTKINFSAKGGISDKSIANHETGAYFIDHNGIYVYNGNVPIYLSKNIEDTWRSLDVTKLSRAVGFIHENKYILAVAEGNSSTNNLIIEYDITNKSFMFKRGFNIESAVNFNRSSLITDGGSNVYGYNLGTTYSDRLISSYWESGYTDLGLPEATKEISSLYLTASGTGSIKVSITTENGTKEVTVALTSSDKVYSINMVHRGRLFKVRIENINGAVFSLKSFKMLYELDID